MYNDTEYFIEPNYHANGTKWNFEHLFYTQKNSLSSSTADIQTIRCPVDGKWWFDCFASYFRYLGEPYFEKEKSYPHYQRSRRNKSRISYKNLSTKSKSIHVEIVPTHRNLKRRAKRQLDFDHMAKHVEVLVAYDQSVKEFHSDTDIKSYILTLFSYVRFCTKQFDLKILYLGVTSIFWCKYWK